MKKGEDTQEVPGALSGDRYCVPPGVRLQPDIPPTQAAGLAATLPQITKCMDNLKECGDLLPVARTYEFALTELKRAFSRVTPHDKILLDEAIPFCTSALNQV
jgi:hypothetical protein